MNTPICDFVRRYSKSNALRLHMPGHKGSDMLGVGSSDIPDADARDILGVDDRNIFSVESIDITEIDGADSLCEANGIIGESEANASALFGAKTFYSTEGSSLCIRAMLYLTCLYARQTGRKPLIAAGRNAHKSFLTAAVLLDFEVKWLYPAAEDASYLSCPIDAEALDSYFSRSFDAKALETSWEHTNTAELPVAVYLTSPDYLGNRIDIGSIAEVCHRYGVLLLVDNAHGAYLKFLPESEHPVDLGADLCCDSAHKTLPVLTGGAYLHIAPDAPDLFAAQAKNAMALFGSTSPSYLILQSLDRANRYLADGYREKLKTFLSEIKACRESLSAHGYRFIANEPLKLTVDAKAYGYSGTDLAKCLLDADIVCEFSDPDFVVMMLTPETGISGLDRLTEALLAIPPKPQIAVKAPRYHRPERVMPPREAYFSVNETIPSSESIGRTLAVSTVGCPPAVPIVVSGERIDAEAVECFQYYGIRHCTVVVSENSAQK